MKLLLNTTFIAHSTLGALRHTDARFTLNRFIAAGNRHERPAFERRLIRGEFDPAVDLEAALARAREVAGRDDAAAHIGADA